jgi:16S rRNA (cytidine1402-2'-O)-methyltransferase
MSGNGPEAPAGIPSGRGAGLPEGACLALVATPIGNLGDITARAITVLEAVDVIACEDTRVTRKLLSALNIPGRRLIAVHGHNERAASEGIVALLHDGNRVALVSDAGTPAISDPGADVVAAVVAAGFPVLAIPGPSAMVSALIISGLPTDAFVMEGFLPARGSDRRARIARIAEETRTTVVYESPHRVVDTLDELSQHCGVGRPVSLSRELTKRFEETWRGALGDAASAIGEPRGEYVIVLGGAPAAARADVAGGDLDALISARLADGVSVKQVAAALADSTGASKSEIYARAVALRTVRTTTKPSPG